jgi:hypothetical protein
LSAVTAVAVLKVASVSLYQGTWIISLMIDELN